MTINDKIRDEKLQYEINREAAKISTLSSGKIDKYEYLTGEEILLSNQSQINRTMQIYVFSLRKSFGKIKRETLKPLNLSNKTTELKKIENIFPKPC